MRSHGVYGGGARTCNNGTKGGGVVEHKRSEVVPILDNKKFQSLADLLGFLGLRAEEQHFLRLLITEPSGAHFRQLCLQVAAACDPTALVFNGVHAAASVEADDRCPPAPLPLLLNHDRVADQPPSEMERAPFRHC